VDNLTIEEIIVKRRSYRSLDTIKITEDIVNELAKNAQLAPSCYNNQPWRFVFVYQDEQLSKLKTALSPGNKWALDSSMIIAVCSRKDLDCDIKNREYFLFDTGMATAFILLKATELGLVAHPIAGFDEDIAKKILEVPDDMQIITLIIVGKHSEAINQSLSPQQAQVEKERPERLSLDKFAFYDTFK